LIFAFAFAFLKKDANIPVGESGEDCRLSNLENFTEILAFHFYKFRVVISQ
jgi:hypothetical protein